MRTELHKDWQTSHLKLLNSLEGIRDARINVVAYKIVMAGIDKSDPKVSRTLREYKLDTGEIVFSSRWHDLGPDGYGYEPSDSIYENYNQALADFKRNVDPKTIKKASSNRKASQVLADLERRIARLERNL